MNPDQENYNQANLAMQPVNKSGKGPIIVIVIIVIIAIAAVVLTWFFMSNNAKKQAQQKDSQIAELNSKVEELNKKIQEAEKNLNASVNTVSEKTALSNRIKEIYKSFIDNGLDYNALYSKGFITKNFQSSSNQNEGLDLLTCSQNPLTYNKYVFKEPNIKTATTATLDVQAPYSSETITIPVAMVKESNVWKIDSITCPAQ